MKNLPTLHTQRHVTILANEYILPRPRWNVGILEHLLVRNAMQLANRSLFLISFDGTGEVRERTIEAHAVRPTLLQRLCRQPVSTDSRMTLALSRRRHFAWAAPLLPLRSKQQTPGDAFMVLPVRPLHRDAESLVESLTSQVRVDEARLPDEEELAPPPLGVSLKAQATIDQPQLIRDIVVIHVLVIIVGHAPPQELVHDLHSCRVAVDFLFLNSNPVNRSERAHSSSLAST